MDWGHSPIEGNIDKAAAANVKKLILFHHDPMRTDEQIDELLLNFRKKLLEQGKSLELYAAKEKWEIEI
jgi:ribonuclease BN (tRNA processing enzyme)